MSEETPKGSGGSFAGAAGAVVLLLAGYFGWGVYQNATTPEADTAVQQVSDTEANEDVQADDAVVDVDADAVSDTDAATDVAEADSTSDSDAEATDVSESDADPSADGEEETETANAADDSETSEGEDPLETAGAADTDETTNAIVPVFDVVRIDPDGNALVAGNAEAGTLEVLIEGDVIAETTVNAGGEFAALFMVEPSDLPRVMTLRGTGEDGQVVLSEQSVIVEPFALPVVVADVTAEEPAVDESTVAQETSAEVADEETVAAAVSEADEAAEATAAVTSEAASGTEETAEARTVIADEDGIRVLPTAVAPSAVRIDTISYGSAGEVLIAGQGTRADETVRIYVNNEALVTADISDVFTWEAVLPDVESGLYVLRADQIGADGAVTSRAQIPFQREAVEAVLAAQLGAGSPAVEDVVTEGNVAPEAPEADAGADESELTVAAVEASESVVTNHVNQGETSDQNGAAETVTEITSDDVIAVASAVAAEETAPVAVTEPVASTGDATSPEVQAEPTPARPQIVTVQPGFTLWGIASETYGDGFLYVQLFEANKDQIRDPDLIYPGQIFELPE
ncbi:LysM peptidoglycan-binding domain-containing protein [Thalassobius sp. I31.1]|uniref:LysM peptidoglycan-binding domain-containing protein n=1 Tax=Thalassobius sp. I31.1 TaxID=2109912 RepID=UPI001E49F1C1|nr:LysM peptidoglycan-binding domain-containing protein [Thalassobius sp. I31.1]